MWYRQINRVALIGYGCAAVLAGIALAAVGLAVPWLVAAVGTLLSWLCVRRRWVVALPAIVLVGLLLGLARGGDMRVQVAQYDQLVGHKVQFTGTVIQDASYGDRGQQDFMMGDVQVGDRRLPGEVRVTTFSSVSPRQGDAVQVSGKAMDGFGSYQLGMYFASVKVTRKGSSPITWLRQQFSAVIRSVIPEPQASLGLGFLLGIKSQLPEELYDQLKVVGLTHIVVASGYNLTILVRAARRLLANRSKFQATAAATGLMVGFVGVTGFSPSMTRAALVTSLSLAAWYYGRVIHPVLLLLFAAAVTGLVNPLYVWYDVGWYLSFLAFGGVMLLSPLVLRRLYGERPVPQIVQIVIETLSAEVATLPLIMFVFGSVSVVGLVANIVVAPLVPVAMLLVFTAGLGVALLPGPGAWLAWPAMLLLSYMTAMVAWLAAIPWAKQALGMDVVGMICAYALLLGIGLFAWWRLRYDYLSKSIVE